MALSFDSVYKNIDVVFLVQAVEHVAGNVPAIGLLLGRLVIFTRRSILLNRYEVLANGDI